MGVLEFLTGLTAAARAALDAKSPDYPIGWMVPVVPGAQVAEDSCCEGMLYGRVVSEAPGSQRTLANGALCAVSSLRWTLAVGTRRCAATLDSRGNPPAAGVIASDGEQMLRDESALRETLLCTPGVSALVSWTPTGPSGGCTGGEWTFIYSEEG